MPFLVCPFPLSHLFFFIFNAIPSFVGIRTSSLQFFRGNLEHCSLSSPLPWNLVQSVPTTAVTTGNCRPCICDKLKNVFSFEENVLRSFDCDECCCSAKILKCGQTEVFVACVTRIVRACDWLVFFLPSSRLWDVQQAHTHIHTR